jgi:signal transduction histidine kinase
VAHELNNPLQSILGFTELLIDAEERPELRRDLEQVRSEAIRAGKIVRNLLAFVRRSSSERAVTHINDIVKGTLALRSYEFGTANIRLFESYADGLPSVVFNPEEIQQVILNLIMNAEQAMRAAHRGGTLTVTTKLLSEMVTIEIADNGPGVPPALSGRVFEPFLLHQGSGGRHWPGVVDCDGHRRGPRRIVEPHPERRGRLFPPVPSRHHRNGAGSHPGLRRVAPVSRFRL